MSLIVRPNIAFWTHSGRGSGAALGQLRQWGTRRQSCECGLLVR